MEQRFITLISFLLVLFLSAGYSQDKVSLTVGDCIKLGMENNKSLKISQSKIEYANEKVSEVNAARLPSLKMSAGYTRLSEIEPFMFKVPTGPNTTRDVIASPALFNNYQLKFTLQQPLFTGFRLMNTASLNEFNARASEEDYKKDKSLLVFDIKNAYWSLYKAVEFRKTILENINMLRAHLKDIESFYNQGLTTQNEVLKVRVQLSNMDYTLLDAESAVQLSMFSLNTIIGLPVTVIIELKAEIIENKEQFLDKEHYFSEAMNTRSEIKGMEYRVKAGESGVSIAQAAWYPQVNFAANYNYFRPNPRIMPSKDEFIGTWDLGIALSFDIWNWMATSYQTSQAQESLEQARLALGQVKDAIMMDVAASYLAIAKAKEKIPVADFAVKQAEENLRVTNEKFRLGAATNTDVLDAETAMMIAKINYISAYADFEIAKAKLEKATGDVRIK